VEDEMVNFSYKKGEGEMIHVTIFYSHPSPSNVLVDKTEHSLKGEIGDLIDKIVNLIENPVVIEVDPPEDEMEKEESSNHNENNSNEEFENNSNEGLVQSTEDLVHSTDDFFQTTDDFDILITSTDELEDHNNKNRETMMLEIENFRRMYGEEKIINCPLSMLNEEVIEIKFNISEFLEKTTAQAWGIKFDYPVIIRIMFNYFYYLEFSKMPEIEVFQIIEDSKKASSGILKQMRGLLKSFISYHWPSKSGKKN